LKKLKKFLKKKQKAKVEVEKEVLVLAEDMTFENEIKKPQVNETRETKSETTSSLTFGE